MIVKIIFISPLCLDYRLTFTRASYNVSIPENCVGRTYARPQERMGIQTGPEVSVRYKIVSGDKDKHFKAEAKQVRWSFLVSLHLHTTQNRLQTQPLVLLLLLLFLVIHLDKYFLTVAIFGNSNKIHTKRHLVCWKVLFKHNHLLLYTHFYRLLTTLPVHGSAISTIPIYLSLHKLIRLIFMYGL